MSILILIMIAAALSVLVVGFVHTVFPSLGAPDKRRPPDSFQFEKKLNAEVIAVLRARQITECALLFGFTGLATTVGLAAVGAYLLSGGTHESSIFSLTVLQGMFAAPVVRSTSYLAGMGWPARVFLSVLICAGLVLINLGSETRARARDLKDYLGKDRISPSVSALFAAWLIPRTDLLLEPQQGEFAVQRTVAAIWRGDMADNREELVKYMASLDLPRAAGGQWRQFVGTGRLQIRSALTLTFLGILMILLSLSRVVPL